MDSTSCEPQNLSKLKFIDLWAEFKEYQRLKLKHQSFRKEVNNYEIHIVPFFENYYVKDITAKLYVNFLNHIENDFDYSYSYKKSIHGCMVSILNYAIKFYDLKENIASKVGGFNKKKSKIKKVDFWTIDEYCKFINAVDIDIYKILFNTLFFTGLRIGECLALTWNDLYDDCLDINKTITKDKNKDNEYIINTPKTESSIRKVNIDKDLIKQLKKLYSIQKKHKDFKKTWYIFGGATPLSQTTINRHKDKYCKLAGVKKIRLHDFRHSHATLLLSQSVPITVISQRLGHSDLATTLNTYSHLVSNDNNKAINVIFKVKTKYELL